MNMTTMISKNVIVFLVCLVFTNILLTGCDHFNPAITGASGHAGSNSDSIIDNNYIVGTAKVAEFGKGSQISDNRARDLEKPFNVDVRYVGKDTCFMVQNNTNYAISYIITMINDVNIVSDKTFPLIGVIQPNSLECAAKIHPLYKDQEYRHKYSHSWSYGDYKSAHEYSDYSVPWTGKEPYKVVYAPDKQYKDEIVRQAVMFDLPVGTPVHAARSGIVSTEATTSKNSRVNLSNVNDSKEHNIDANLYYIEVVHDDGTIASYTNLLENSAAVKIGQTISKGELIGRSGSNKMQLEVWVPIQSGSTFNSKSLPIRFSFNDIQKNISLKSGDTVTIDGIVTEAVKLQSTVRQIVPTVPYVNVSSLFNSGFVTIKEGCYSKAKNEGIKCVKNFSIGKYEVTQGQWQSVMGSNPSRNKSCGLDCPVENVSWEDIDKFIDHLNKVTSKKYRLPTEAEWEYAARSGKVNKIPSANDIKNMVWFSANSNGAIHPVGKKEPNLLGLHDMNGNVGEWVSDWWLENKSKNGVKQGTSDPPQAALRLLCGGSWRSPQADVLLTSRCLIADPSVRAGDVGFRLIIDGK